MAEAGINFLPKFLNEFGTKYQTGCILCQGIIFNPNQEWITDRKANPSGLTKREFKEFCIKCMDISSDQINVERDDDSFPFCQNCTKTNVCKLVQVCKQLCDLEKEFAGMRSALTGKVIKTYLQASTTHDSEEENIFLDHWKQTKGKQGMIFTDVFQFDRGLDPPAVPLKVIHLDVCEDEHLISPQTPTCSCSLSLLQPEPMNDDDHEMEDSSVELLPRFNIPRRSQKQGILIDINGKRGTNSRSAYDQEIVIDLESDSESKDEGSSPVQLEPKRIRPLPSKRAGTKQTKRSLKIKSANKVAPGKRRTKCKICFKMIYKSYMTLHNRTHNNNNNINPNKTHKCTECKSTFSLLAFKIHMARKHKVFDTNEYTLGFVKSKDITFKLKNQTEINNTEPSCFSLYYWLRCALCNIPLEDLAAVRIHLQSKQHLDKVEESKIQIQGSG